MTDEQHHYALDAYRHLTRAAECAEKAGFALVAKNIRQERRTIDDAIARADRTESEEKSTPPEV